jgi:DNA-binding NarL/FixJ family response regulator
MVTERPQHLSNILFAKTCSRCGQGFGALGREYACPNCKQATADRAPCSAPRLTFREKQIVFLIRKAKSNKEIAHELCLTVGTVKEYIFHIFRKLGVANRTELALWGRERETELAS